MEEISESLKKRTKADIYPPDVIRCRQTGTLSVVCSDSPAEPPATTASWPHGLDVEKGPRRLLPRIGPVVSEIPSPLGRALPKNRRNLGFPGVHGLAARNRKTEWWARQDSNLQPDRYERSALTN